MADPTWQSGTGARTSNAGRDVIYKRTRVQMGIKNVFDRNYYYTAGFPEEGRSWFLNLRCQF
jgi:iron complex outermembrane receptor protein